MNDADQIHAIRRRLKAAMAPIEVAPATDLWPRMLVRLAEPSVSFGWFETTLAAVVVISLLVFPKLIPMMLYHL